MLKLKEFYQYKRDLKKNNLVLQKKLRFQLPSINLPKTRCNLIPRNFRALLYIKVSNSNTFNHS